MSHFPIQIIDALKDAVVKVFWQVQDMRRLLTTCGVPESLINKQDWTLYKWKILTPIADILNSSDDGLGSLRRIVRETLRFTDCGHLLRYPDGIKKKKDAEEAVERLRKLVSEFDTDLEKKKKAEDDIKKRRSDGASKRSFESNLADIKTRFYKYIGDPNAQAKGFGLESILYELFLLFDLDPKGPFRRIGEQIDGGFSLDTEQFLLEAKWQANPVNLADLRDLDGAVGSSLDNTLGLFISINGFSEPGLTEYLRGGRPRIICMDGEDLTMVLEGMFDLAEMLRRKKQIAVQKKKIFSRAKDILSGKI